MSAKDSKIGSRRRKSRKSKGGGGAFILSAPARMVSTHSPMRVVSAHSPVRVVSTHSPVRVVSTHSPIRVVSSTSGILDDNYNKIYRLSLMHTNPLIAATMFKNVVLPNSTVYRLNSNYVSLAHSLRGRLLSMLANSTMAYRPSIIDLTRNIDAFLNESHVSRSTKSSSKRRRRSSKSKGKGSKRRRSSSKRSRKN